MLKASCLLNNTAIVNDLKSAMQVFAAERLENGKSASFPLLFYALKSEGIEIDASTAGFAYNEVFGQLAERDARISTINEVNEFAGRAVAEQVQEIADIIMGDPIGHFIYFLLCLIP